MESPGRQFHFHLVTGGAHGAAIKNRKSPSPLYTLPPEILGLIFEATQQMLLSIDEEEARQFPLVASQVARYWRNVVLDSPMLWASIDVSPPLIIDAVQLRLERSRCYPIDLNLVVPPGGEVDLQHYSVDDLGAVIIPHISHCRSIIIFRDAECDAEPLTKLLLHIVGSSAPLLERLSLLWHEAASDVLHGVPVFSRMPMLMDARLGGVALFCGLPLSSLTELHLSRHGHSIPYAHFRRLMTSSLSLTTLAIYDDVIAWPRTPSIETFKIDTLRSLQIYGSMLNVSELLTCMFAYNVEELLIVPFLPNDLVSLPFPSTSVPSIFPKLKSLALGATSSDPFDFTKASYCFPTVERLILMNVYASELTNIFLNDRVPWPCLQTLALRNLDSGDDEEVLGDTIICRKDSGHPLRRLCLDSYTIRCFHHLSWLKDQVEVEESDIWLLYQKNALYSDDEGRYLDY